MQFSYSTCHCTHSFIAENYRQSFRLKIRLILSVSQPRFILLFYSKAKMGVFLLCLTIFINFQFWKILIFNRYKSLNWFWLNLYFQKRLKFESEKYKVALHSIKRCFWKVKFRQQVFSKLLIKAWYMLQSNLSVLSHYELRFKNLFVPSKQK